MCAPGECVCVCVCGGCGGDAWRWLLVLPSDMVNKQKWFFLTTEEEVKTQLDPLA